MEHKLYTLAELEERKAAGQLEASESFTAIVARAPWLLDLPQIVWRIVEENASTKAKLGKFRALAERIADAVRPSSVCSDGCSHCCYIPVSMSQSEAGWIGAATGIKPADVPRRTAQEYADQQDDFLRVPCTFLNDDRCSIYEFRPLECRLHFNISASPMFCDTSIRSEESVVPNVDLSVFWIAYASLTATIAYGDLREFFPKSKE